MNRGADITVLFLPKKQMFEKPLPFFISVWYYKTQKRMYVLKLCSNEMVMIAGGLIFNIDFYCADLVAVIMGFIVLYFGVVAILTDN